MPISELSIFFANTLKYQSLAIKKYLRISFEL